jgi:hypothetical protein
VRHHHPAPPPLHNRPRGALHSAKAARQVPQRSRERLAARAGLMVGPVATAA